MKDLFIEGTNKTMEISCKRGLIAFSGRSILNDPNSFFTPVENWIKEYIKSPESVTIINCKFEYIDTASFKRIFHLLKEFEKIRDNYTVEINWYVDDDDPEIMELGNILENRTVIKFNIIQSW